MLAQLVEQGTLNAWVGGSSPSQPTYLSLYHSLVKKRISLALVCSSALFLPTFTAPIKAQASSPNIYEAMTGTHSTSMNSVAGSSNSVGLTGNWVRVPGIKSGNDAVRAAVFTNAYNANLAFPTNSLLTLPASNTAAGTTTNVWSPFGSARALTSPISFDSAGTYYFSYLMFAPNDGWGNWGSAVAGLLNGLPSNNTDSSKRALYFGWTYAGAPIIKLDSANLPVWEGGSYGAVGASTSSVATGNKSWFVVVRINTVATGNDSVRIKLFAPSGTIPTSDSAITWDATYSTPITGDWTHLAVQTEYNGLIDEIRGGLSYSGVAGFASATTLGAPSISGLVRKGNSSTISVSVNAPGFVRFFINGKRIPGCLKVATSGTSPNFTASCTWKPSVQGTRTFSASFTPADSTFLAADSSPSVFPISKRTNTR